MAEKPSTLQPTLFRGVSRFFNMTLLSRCFGFLRDLTSAQLFGASPTFSAFLVAFQIPNFLRNVISEGAFAQAFVPVLSEYRMRCESESVSLVQSLTWVMACVSVALALLGLWQAHALIHLYAPGFSQDGIRAMHAIAFLHWTFPTVIAIGLSAIASAWLQCHHRFALAASLPVFMNIILWGAMLWSAHHAMQHPLLFVAKMVPLAGLIQCLLVWGQCLRLGYFSQSSWRWRFHPGVKKVARLMAGSFLGTSVGQLGILMDTVLASFLPHGSIAWMYFTTRLVYLPLGLIGVGVATVVLPKLSMDSAQGDHQGFIKKLDWGIQVVLLVALPATLGLISLSYPIISTLFQYRAFGVHDTWMTHLSLMAFASGLPAFMMVKVLANGFYAHQDTKTPVKVACFTLIINLLVSLELMQTFHHVGLLFATVLSSYAQCVILYVLFKRRYLKKNEGLSFEMVPMMLVSSLAMAWALSMTELPNTFWDQATALMRCLALSWRILFGVLIFFLTLSIRFKPKRLLAMLTEAA